MPRYFTLLLLIISVALPAILQASDKPVSYVDYLKERVSALKSLGSYSVKWEEFTLLDSSPNHTPLKKWHSLIDCGDKFRYEQGIVTVAGIADVTVICFNGREWSNFDTQTRALAIGVSSTASFPIKMKQSPVYFGLIGITDPISIPGRQESRPIMLRDLSSTLLTERIADVEKIIERSGDNWLLKKLFFAESAFPIPPTQFPDRRPFFIEIEYNASLESFVSKTSFELVSGAKRPLSAPSERIGVFSLQVTGGKTIAKVPKVHSRCQLDPSGKVVSTMSTTVSALIAHPEITDDMFVIDPVLAQTVLDADNGYVKKE